MKIQGRLNKDLKTMRQILELFHPNAPKIDDNKLTSMCKNGAYDWVYISGNIPNYGRVEVAIDNGHDTTGMYGTGWKLKDFEERQPKMVFNIWRCSGDKLPTNDLTNFDKDLREFKNSESYKLRPKYTEILKSAGYQTLTAKEWMTEYYDD